MREDIDSSSFILAEKYLPDGRKLTIEPQTFGCARIGIGEYPPHQDSMTYADTWDFPSKAAALLAYANWNAEEEPTDWHRHHATGRYRHGGNPDLEYIRWEGTDEQHIKHAMKVLRSEERFIVSIHDEVREPFSLPDARIYLVTTESNTCQCRIPCTWYDYAYLYLDRCVILNIVDTMKISLATLKKRLYG